MFRNGRSYVSLESPASIRLRFQHGGLCDGGLSPRRPIPQIGGTLEHAVARSALARALCKHGVQSTPSRARHRFRGETRDRNASPRQRDQRYPCDSYRGRAINIACGSVASPTIDLTLRVQKYGRTCVPVLRCSCAASYQLVDDRGFTSTSSRAQ
jgi:hypothetical protein